MEDRICELREPRDEDFDENAVDDRNEVRDQDDQSGAKATPRPRKINTINALMKISQPKGQEFAVFTYFLNRDIITPEGQVDNLYGVVFHMGTYPTFNRAEKRAKQIIEMTGCVDVIVAKLGLPARLTVHPDTHLVTEVPVDLKGKLIEMQNKSWAEEEKRAEEQMSIQEEILADKEAEKDPNHPEYFRHQCFLAIRNRANYQHYKKMADDAWERYKEREQKIREFYHDNPNGHGIEEVWLENLEKKLARRDEKALFAMMKTAYEEIRDELLGLEPKSVTLTPEPTPTPTPSPEPEPESPAIPKTPANSEEDGGVCILGGDCYPEPVIHEEVMSTTYEEPRDEVMSTAYEEPREETVGLGFNEEVRKKGRRKR